MDNPLKTSLDAIFKPKSVAIVGASNNRKKWGFETLQDMIAIGYRHPIYPINPKEEEVQGYRAYPSITDVPGDIDLAIIVVKIDLVPGVIEECIRKKVKGGIVITAGFAEVGAEGRELQREMAEKGRAAGFHFIGPNCWGIWSTEGKVNTVFYEGLHLPPGPISFVSQSGTLGEYLYNATQKNGFGVSKFVSTGNQACISFTDLIEYLGDDPTTKVIVGYVEGIGDGRRFLEVASKVSAKKPLLIFKGGSTEAAARAAQSHTASMAGDDRMFDAACHQAGVIRCHNFMEMFYMADALCYQPLPAGNRVAVISPGGGFCVTATEACTRIGLDLPKMSPTAEAELRSQMDEHAPPPVNPIDCIARKGRDAYRNIVEIVLKQDYIDGVIMTPSLGRFDRVVAPKSMVPQIQFAADLVELLKKYNKPMVMASEAEMSGPVYEIYKGNHIPFFDNPVDCAKALYALSKYGEIRNRP